MKGPKLRELSAALGNRRAKDKALGILTCLWLWGLDNADEYGKLRSADEEDIADVFSRYTESPVDKVVEALFETGWLDRIGEDIYIHDWRIWQDQWYKAKERREADKKRYHEKKNDTGEGVNYSPEHHEQLTILGAEDEGIGLNAEANDQICGEADDPPKQPPAHPEPPKSPQQQSYTPQFEELWNAYYGEKGAKAEAYKVYKARLNDGWTHQQLYQAVLSYAAQEKRNGTEKRYVKRVKTFLGPNTPFIDFLPNNGSLKRDDPTVVRKNPFEEFEEDQ